MVFVSITAAALFASVGVAKADASSPALLEQNRIHHHISPLYFDSGRTRGLEVQKLQCRLLLADKIETRDRIEYFTDPDDGRAFEEVRRHEIEKEERSWKMLDDMQLYVFPRNKSHRNSSEVPRQQ